MELDPVHKRVVVDGPRVGGAAAQRLKVYLSGALKVSPGDRGERNQLENSTTSRHDRLDDDAAAARDGHPWVPSCCP